MMEHKRSISSLDETSFVELMPKRSKTDEKKERVSERIAALQKLVSPFGKTDTASVLTEAMEYIRFLHEQVKVLSAPYLYSSPTNQMPDVETLGVLKAKGLCVVPTSLTFGVSSSNGADIWAPIKTSHVNSRRWVSDEASTLTRSQLFAAETCHDVRTA